MKARIVLLCAFFCIISLFTGCSGAGAGGVPQSTDPHGTETTQTQDSTLAPDQVVATPQSNGSYLFQVVDWKTGAAISGATVTFRTGGSTVSDASGFFTVPGDIEFSVQKDGYEVSTSISNGNLIKKQPLNPALFGTWICYEADAPAGIKPQSVTDINDIVTFNSNGTTTRSGEFGTWSRDYLADTTSTGAINFGFLYHEGTPADAYKWAAPGATKADLFQLPLCFTPVKVDGEVLSRQCYSNTYTYRYTHDGRPPGTVSVMGVNLDKVTESIAIGSTDQLTATIVPSNATNQGVTWTSSNTGVATVSATGLSAVVAAVAAGATTITVTTSDGGHTATCDVTVTNAGGSEIGFCVWISSGVTFNQNIYLQINGSVVGIVGHASFASEPAWGQSGTFTISEPAGTYTLYAYDYPKPPYGSYNSWGPAIFTLTSSTPGKMIEITGLALAE
jgi:uncharacterized protein YjdB